MYSALTISISYKITEILRFTKAVHTAAWYPWILFAITKIFCADNMQLTLKYAALLIIFYICLITAGYPYYVVYSVFLISPYILFFIIRKLNSYFFYDKIEYLAKKICVLIVAFIIVLIITFPYFLKVNSLMKQTTDRAGNNFEYAANVKYGISDTIGSLIYPINTQPGGWYYFGIFNFLLVLSFFSFKNNKRLISIFFLGWLFFIVYITYGKDSYLFKFLWNYMPIFSSLREWPRLNIILLPILSLILALSFDEFYNSFILKNCSLTELKTKFQKILFFGAIIILIQLIWLIKIKYHAEWKLYYIDLRFGFLLNLPAEKWQEVMALPDFFVKFFLNLNINKIAVLFGMLYILSAVLSLIIFYAIYKYKIKKIKLAILILLIFTSIDNFLIGPWLWSAQRKNTSRHILQINEKNMRSFNVPRIDKYYTLSHTDEFNAGIVGNWYFDRYVKFRNKYRSTEEEAYKKLMGVIDGKKIYFSKKIDYSTIKEFLDDSKNVNYKVNVLYYDGDVLKLELFCEAPGYLSFIDNWDNSWKAYVNNVEKQIELLFGTFKSVYISEPKNIVVFEYKF